MGVAVGISSLGGIELEIPLGGIFTPPPWPLTVGKNLGHMRVKYDVGLIVATRV